MEQFVPPKRAFVSWRHLLFLPKERMAKTHFRCDLKNKLPTSEGLLDEPGHGRVSIQNPGNVWTKPSGTTSLTSEATVAPFASTLEYPQTS